MLGSLCSHNTNTDSQSTRLPVLSSLTGIINSHCKDLGSNVLLGCLQRVLMRRITPLSKLSIPSYVGKASSILAF